MTQAEFENINWHRGNVVKLNNGKEYLVKGVKGHGKYLLLYSLEYDSRFVADYNIVNSRVSDYEEPEEVYLKHKRKKQAEAEAKREAERQEALRIKAERKRKNIEEQERLHQEAVARKAAAKALRQKNQAAAKTEQKEVAKPAPLPKEEPKEEPKAQKAEAPKAEVPKAVKVEEPAAEAPKKRVRQRIKVTSAVPVREKVEFYKKK